MDGANPAPPRTAPMVRCGIAVPREANWLERGCVMVAKPGAAAELARIDAARPAFGRAAPPKKVVLPLWKKNPFRPLNATLDPS